MKRTIWENAWGNWYGYEGGRKVVSFGNDSDGTQEQHARAWLAAGPLRITSDMLKAIRAAARSAYGRNLELEAGTRYADNDRPTANALLWSRGADLYDCTLISGPFDVEQDHALPGCALLDIYCTSRGWNGQLEGNLYVTIKNGEVVDAHDKDLQAERRAQALLGRGYRNEEV